MTRIESFRGQYAFLSNFYAAVVSLDGVDYMTVEQAFQAAKTESREERRQIQLAVSPASAKEMGQHVTLRPDWETVKFSIMEDLVRQKFTYHPELRDMLLATGDAEIIEGNDWNDRTWGMTKDKDGQWVGENRLGKLIMAIRAELRDAD